MHSQRLGVSIELVRVAAEATQSWMAFPLAFYCQRSNMNCTACLVSPERSRGARVLRPELAERARQELCRTRSTLHSQLSIANCALAMSALAIPMLPRTARTFGPASFAPNRAGPLEMQTHQLCPPGQISAL